MTDCNPKPLDPVALPRESAVAPAAIRSDELLHGQREILIIHEQEVYRLRLTRNGKLILTK